MKRLIGLWMIVLGGMLYAGCGGDAKQAEEAAAKAKMETERRRPKCGRRPTRGIRRRLM